MVNFKYLFTALSLVIILTNACQQSIHEKELTPDKKTPVGLTKSKAKTLNGQFIAWKEHLIDDLQISGVKLSGSDG